VTNTKAKKIPQGFCGAAGFSFDWLSRLQHGTSSNATMLMILINGFTAGPAVSL